MIISYYGHPYSPVMGILGEGTREEIEERLRQQVEAYRSLDDEAEPTLAFHMVYAVAQESSGPDGTFIFHTPDSVVREYIDYTRERDMLLFLDLQNGRADIESEVRNILPYLSEPHVHLALDPEFTMTPEQTPGISIGSISGDQINRVQKILQDLVTEQGLPSKLLVVHQFLDDMVVDKESIETFERVDLVFVMDGYGDGETKKEKYYQYSVDPERHAGIKLFYQWDDDLLTPEALLGLQPRPGIIMYQ